MSKRLKVAFTVVILFLIGFFLLQRQRSCPLPVLMYHHFSEEVIADTYVTPETFKNQLTAIKEAGFSTITIEQILNYVYWGIPLPDKSILITIDDGYTSNISMAAPILEELDMCATVFVIGYYEGKEMDERTGLSIHPERFSYDEAAEWVEKGVLDLQCHSFDMHQLAVDGISERNGMLPLPNEDFNAYRSAIIQDIDQFRDSRDSTIKTPLTALAYPYGYYTHELDQILREERFQITFTVDEYCSQIRVWDKNSLRMLGRYNVTENWSEENLVEHLEQAIR